MRKPIAVPVCKLSVCLQPFRLSSVFGVCAAVEYRKKSIPTRSLRSANTNLLSVPRVRTTFASRRFSIAAPTVWNSLPSSIRSSTSADTFRRLLKTHCFQQAYCSPSGSAKCLRFGHWLTLCTLNMHVLTYLLKMNLEWHADSLQTNTIH